MPVQFSNTSNVRGFRFTNSPSAIAFTTGRSTPTGMNNGSPNRQFNMPLTNTRRNANWSKKRMALERRSRIQSRAGINYTPMPISTNLAGLKGLKNQSVAANIKKEYNQTQQMAANAAMRYGTANSSRASNILAGRPRTTGGKYKHTRKLPR